MATAPKKKPAPPAPAKKAPAAPAKAKAKAQVEETEAEEEEEAPAPKARAKPTPAPKAKAKPEPEEEPEEEEAAEEGDEAEGDETEGDETEGDETASEEGDEGDEGEDEIFPSDELLDLAKALKSNFQGQGAKESEQDYYKRLVATLAKCSDEQYEELSAESQGWYNDAVEAINGGKAIPALRGHDTTPAPAPKSGKGNTAALEKYRKDKAEAEARGETLPKKEKKKKGDGVRTSNSTYPVFLEMALDHSATLAQVTERLKKKGIDVNPSTASTTRGGALAMLRALKEAGKYDPD